MTALTHRPESTPSSPGVLPRRGWSRRRVVAVALTALAACAAFSVALVVGGAPAVLATLPVAAWGAVVLLVLALTRFAWFVLALLGVRAAVDSLPGVGPVSVNVALSLGFLVAGLIWLAGDVRAGGTRTRTWPPSVALLLAGVLSSFLAPDLLASAQEWLRIAAGLLMLEIAQRITRDSRLVVALFLALVLSTIVPAVFGLVQAASGDGDLIGGFTRIIGTFRHPNPFAIYLALLLITSIAMARHLALLPKVVTVVLAVPALACLVLTLTRTGWIGLVVGVTVVALLQQKKLLVAMAALVLAVGLLVPTAGARLADLATLEAPSGATGNSLVWRVQYWADTVALSEGQPITGLGLGSVRIETEEAKQPHNDFVRTMAELGVLGLLAYVWLLVALALTARDALRSTRGLVRDPRRGGAVAVAAVVTTVVMVSLTSNVISQVVLLWYIAGAVGLAGPALALAQRRRRGGPVEPEAQREPVPEQVGS